METIVSHAPLNETQVFLLQAFSHVRSEKEKTDIQALLLDYYRKNVDDYASRISLTNEKIDEILNSHYRTPSK